MSYDGFPKQTLAFLRGLARNNEKVWFDAHRSDYDRYWVEPAKEFVEAAGEALQKIAPVNYEPRVNGSIFRINRDIRFSNDKTPYKNHLDFWFWEGERKGAVSGFFMRVGPKQLGIGVGAHGFDKDRLARFRDMVVDDEAGSALVKAVKAADRAGYPVKGEHYKTVPKTHVAANEHQERLLRFNALWCGEDTSIPDEIYSKDIVKYAVGRWRKLAPVHRWLMSYLD